MVVTFTLDEVQVPELGILVSCLFFIAMNDIYTLYHTIIQVSGPQLVHVWPHTANHSIRDLVCGRPVKVIKKWLRFSKILGLGDFRNREPASIRDMNENVWKGESGASGFEERGQP